MPKLIERVGGDPDNPVEPTTLANVVISEWITKDLNDGIDKNVQSQVVLGSTITHLADCISDFSLKNIETKAFGGRILGAGGPKADKVPAMLSNGEFVIKTAAAKKLGYSNLEHMNNNGELPGFADGGLFGSGLKQAEGWSDWLSKKRLDIADKLFEKKGKAEYKDSGFISAGMKKKADSALYKAQDLGMMGLLAAGEMFTKVGIKGPLELMSMLEKGKSVIDEKGVSGAYKDVVKGTAKGMEFVSGLDKEKVCAIGSSIGTSIKDDIKKGGMGISSGVLETLIPTGAGTKLVKDIMNETGTITKVIKKSGEFAKKHNKLVPNVAGAAIASQIPDLSGIVLGSLGMDISPAILTLPLFQILQNAGLKKQMKSKKIWKDVSKAERGELGPLDSFKLGANEGLFPELETLTSLIPKPDRSIKSSVDDIKERFKYKKMVEKKGNDKKSDSFFGYNADMGDTTLGLAKEFFSSDLMRSAGKNLAKASVPLVDYSTGLFNTSKNIIASSDVLAPIARKIFVENPVKNKFKKGLSPVEDRFTVAKKFIGDYFLNPLTSEMQDVAYKVGRGARGVYSKSPLGNQAGAVRLPGAPKDVKSMTGLINKTPSERDMIEGLGKQIGTGKLAKSKFSDTDFEDLSIRQQLDKIETSKTSSIARKLNTIGLKSDPDYESILKTIPEESTFLSSGIEALVFKTPDGKIKRIAKRSEFEAEAGVGPLRPDTPDVLQPEHTDIFKNYVSETLPDIGKTVSQLPDGEQLNMLDRVRDLKMSLMKSGYYAPDLHLDNVYLDPEGKMKALDPGMFVKYNKNIPVGDVAEKMNKSLFSRHHELDDYIKKYTEPEDKLDDIDDLLAGFADMPSAGFVDRKMGEAPSTGLMRAVSESGSPKDRFNIASSMSQLERKEYMSKVVADTNKKLNEVKPGIKLSYDNTGDIDPLDIGRYKQSEYALTQMVDLFPEAFKETNIRLKTGTAFDVEGEASGLTRASGLWDPMKNELSSSIGSGPSTALHEVGHLLSSSKTFENKQLKLLRGPKMRDIGLSDLRTRREQNMFGKEGSDYKTLLEDDDRFMQAKRDVTTLHGLMRSGIDKTGKYSVTDDMEKFFVEKGIKYGGGESSNLSDYLWKAADRGGKDPEELWASMFGEAFLSPKDKLSASKDLLSGWTGFRKSNKEEIAKEYSKLYEVEKQRKTAPSAYTDDSGDLVLDLFAEGGKVDTEQRKKDFLNKYMIEKGLKQEDKYEKYKNIKPKELSSFYKKGLKKHKGSADPSDRENAFMVTTSAVKSLYDSPGSNYPYAHGKVSNKLDIGEFDRFTDEDKYGAGIRSDRSVDAARGAIKRVSETDRMLELLSTREGPKSEAEHKLFGDVASGKKISPKRIKALFGLYEARINNPDSDKHMDAIKGAKSFYVKAAMEYAKQSGIVGDYAGKDFMDKFFADPKAHLEKTTKSDLDKQVEEILKSLKDEKPVNTGVAFADQMADADVAYDKMKNKQVTTRHSGGPVFKDGLHNLQKGEFVVPKHFGDGGMVSGGLESANTSSSAIVVGKMEEVFDDFLTQLEGILDDSKIEAPEFPELTISNLDEVKGLLELTVPDIPDIKIEDLDKLTSISIDGIEGLGNIPDHITVEVAGSVDTGTSDTNMTDTITTAINDALREANVGADGRDDLAAVFSDIRDQILGINGRVDEGAEGMTILNEDFYKLDDDYKSHKSGMITTVNELRTLSTDLTNNVKGTVRSNQLSISELERGSREIKTKLSSIESRQTIG